MEPDLCVIVPSRGAPDNLARLLLAWQDAASASRLLVVLDDDDPDYPAYVDIIGSSDLPESLLDVDSSPRERTAKRLNDLARHEARRYPYVGYMMDTYAPVTIGWDDRVTDTLSLPDIGLVYCNPLADLRNLLPKALFFDSALVFDLDYMCPPEWAAVPLDQIEEAWPTGVAYLERVIVASHPQR